jgi:hypothetical protein
MLIIDLSNNHLIIANNNLTDVSLQLLSSFNWPILRILMLNFNKFTAKGVDHLSYSKWPILERLDLCKNQNIQHRTISLIKD